MGNPHIFSMNEKYSGSSFLGIPSGHKALMERSDDFGRFMARILFLYLHIDADGGIFELTSLRS